MNNEELRDLVNQLKRFIKNNCVNEEEKERIEDVIDQVQFEIK